MPFFVQVRQKLHHSKIHRIRKSRAKKSDPRNSKRAARHGLNVVDMSRLDVRQSQLRGVRLIRQASRRAVKQTGLALRLYKVGGKS